MSKKQISITVCQKMNNKMMTHVDNGLYSDRQDLIISAIRNHAHTLTESTAECMMFYGHLINNDANLSKDIREDRIDRNMAKFVSNSFDGSGLLDVYEYFFPGQEQNVRINIRIPENILDTWLNFAPYSNHRKTIANYVRDCITLELLRIDEDMRILSTIKIWKNGNSSSSELKKRHDELIAVLGGRHGYLLNYYSHSPVKPDNYDTLPQIN